MPSKELSQGDCSPSVGVRDMLEIAMRVVDAHSSLGHSNVAAIKSQQVGVESVRDGG